MGRISVDQHLCHRAIDDNHHLAGPDREFAGLTADVDRPSSSSFGKWTRSRTISPATSTNQASWAAKTGRRFAAVSRQMASGDQPGRTASCADAEAAPQTRPGACSWPGTSSWALFVQKQWLVYSRTRPRKQVLSGIKSRVPESYVGGSPCDSARFMHSPRGESHWGRKCEVI